MTLSLKARSLVIALIATLVLSTVAYAVYYVWTGTAYLTVDEAIIIEYDSSSNGVWDEPTKTWTVHSYPGESKSITFNATNVSDGDLQVTASVSTPAYLEDIVVSWIPYSLCLGGGKHEEFTLEIDIGAEASVGSMEFTLKFGRSECE